MAGVSDDYVKVRRIAAGLQPATLVLVLSGSVVFESVLRNVRRDLSRVSRQDVLPTALRVGVAVDLDSAWSAFTPRPVGGDMLEAPVAPFLEHELARSHFPRFAHTRPPTSSSSNWATTVEIIAPDRYCADLLVELAAPQFRAEIVSDLSWIVRLQLPPTGGGWVSELLSLVEGWLESVPLPCTKILYGDRSYLARSPIEPARAYKSTARSGPGTSSLTRI